MTGWTLKKDKELLYGNIEAIKQKLSSMRRYLAINSCYSCLLFKTHVIKFNYERQYAWVNEKKNFYCTYHRFNQEHLSLDQVRERAVLHALNKNNKNWFYLWFLGVSDGFGSFVIVNQNNNWNFAFKITQPLFNLRLLYYIKKELGVGSVVKDNVRAQFIIRDRNKLKNTIFPILDKYPLLTIKKLNYDNFKQAYFILEDNNLTWDEKNKTLFIIRNKIKSVQVALSIQAWPSSEIWNKTAFFDLKSVNSVKNVITKPWVVGFIETKGLFSLVTYSGTSPLNSVTNSTQICCASESEKGHMKDSSSYSEVRIVNRFRLIQKSNGEILEAIRSIFHISTKVKFDSKYNLYILDTTNSRGIKNIVNYFQGTFKGMKALSFRLWSRALSKQYNVKNHLKIQRILQRVENKLSYPFILSKKFSTQATFSIVSSDSRSLNVQLNPYYLTGFVDGEGCFIVSIYKRSAKDSKTGWGVRAQFQMVLHKRDLP